MRMHLAAPAAFVLLALAAAGCSRSPRVNFYTLSPAAAVQAPGQGFETLSVAVGPVTLPELVDRPQLVVRVAENRVDVLETHRWAEPLKSEIPRLLAQNLGRLLDSDRVAYYGQNAASEAQYKVLVDIVRLESAPGDSVTVEAFWTVRRTGSASSAGRSVVKEKTTEAGYEALVAACSRALARVSGDIAKAIRAEAGR